MKLSVACNFDPGLVEAIREFPVYELYGKVTSDAVGGGRASFTLPSVGKKKLKNYVKLVHDAGIEFNYLLNSSCLENREFTRAGQRDIRKLLNWLLETGVDSVTINHPLLLKIVKKSYPSLKTRIGVFAAVNSIQRAKFWESEGADCICLEDIAVNRDFELLSKIRESVVKCDLQLLVNNSCFYSCGMSGAHMNMLSHASQSKHRSKGFYVDYCMVRCTGEKLNSPVNYIRASWIRPEDLIHYRKIGYENFKIVERLSPTYLLKDRVKAYTDGRYKGNLLCLVQPYGYSDSTKNNFSKLRLFLRYFLRPFSINLLKMKKIKDLTEKQGMLSSFDAAPPVVIKNEDLNGFIKPFLSESCSIKNCSECRYCHLIAEKYVQINPGYKKECQELYKDLTEEIESGSMWN